MRVAGFVKVRNEIIREGNLYRLLAQLEKLCDCGIVRDDASTDGTREAVESWTGEQNKLAFHPGDLWLAGRTQPYEQDWRREMHVKQEMLDSVHLLMPDWILWVDGDELFDEESLARFRPWLESVDKEPIDAWSFHYTQPWRTMRWARIDSGFDDGRFWKLWRYQPDLAFETRNELHTYQFPKNYLDEILDYVDHNRARRRQMAGKPAPRAMLAPLEILHLGNVGKNLVWKAISYRGSGRLEDASLKRHLYFGEEASYRPLAAGLVPDSALPQGEEKPMMFTGHERAMIERMERLRETPGLVTIIVPTFNRAYALDRTLASVLAQTYTNWCCVVLDDGSTDATSEIMRAWQDRDPRFFYCRYPGNRGGVAMNEIGMALACEFGDFWVRLGSDDYFEPHKLALDIAAFRQAPAAGVVFGPYLDLHESGPGRGLGLDMRNCGVDARHALLSGGFAASWANIAVRASALKEVRAHFGSFVDPQIRNMEDWLANTRLAHLTEYAWRGLTLAGELIIVLGEGDYAVVHPSNLRHDAIWRLSPDGASLGAYGNQSNIDVDLTRAALVRDTAKCAPVVRIAYTVHRASWGEAQ